MPSLIRSALEGAQDFLIEPARQTCRDALPVEVVVLGLSPGCGVTTLARGLAISLDVPGVRQSHVLAIGGDANVTARSARGGRDGPSALVWDVASSEADRARVAAQRADATLLVAGPGNEPALAEVVVSMLGEGFGRVVLIANRVRDESRWSGRAGVCIPESRLGVALLRRGRRPRGALGAAFTRLTALVEASA